RGPRGDSGPAGGALPDAPGGGSGQQAGPPAGGTDRNSSTGNKSRPSGPSELDPATQDTTASRMSKLGTWLWKSLKSGPTQTARHTLWGRVSRNGGGEQSSGLATMVTSTQFELTMAVVILTNALCICAEAQYNGMDSGYRAGVAPRESQPADMAWPGAAAVFLGIEWFYGILFTSELLLKIVAVPRKTLKDSWSLIDALVVGFFWIEALSSDLPFPPTLIRLARMARLLRFLRVVKTIRGFASLYLMLQSIKGSVSALGWSSVVLLLGEMMIALSLNLFLSDYWESDEWTQQERERLYGAGGFRHFFQVAADNDRDAAGQLVHHHTHSRPLQRVVHAFWHLPSAGLRVRSDRSYFGRVPQRNVQSRGPGR
ncbi:unnamed protein product, partial [Prorocentrum cordatum]